MQNSKSASQPLIFLQKQSKGMMIMLTIQFVVGMLVNLFSVAADDPKYASQPLLIKAALPTHMIIGILLPIGAISSLVFAVKSGLRPLRQLALYGFLSILLAAGAGIATVVLKDNASEIASYIMSLGFILSFVCYGSLYFQVRK